MTVAPIAVALLTSFLYALILATDELFGLFVLKLLLFTSPTFLITEAFCAVITLTLLRVGTEPFFGRPPMPGPGITIDS